MDKITSLPLSSSLTAQSGSSIQDLKKLAAGLKTAFNDPNLHTDALGPYQLKNPNRQGKFENHSIETQLWEHYNYYPLEFIRVESQANKASSDFKSSMSIPDLSSKQKTDITKALAKIEDFFQKGNFSQVAYLCVRGTAFNDHLLAGIKPNGQMIALKAAYYD